LKIFLGLWWKAVLKSIPVRLLALTSWGFSAAFETKKTKRKKKNAGGRRKKEGKRTKKRSS